MKRLQKFKPAFWNHRDITGNHPHTGFNFARKWKLIVLFTSFMALLPLFVMTIVDFNLTRRTIEDEVKGSMAEILTSAAAYISFCKNMNQHDLNFITRFETGEDNDIFVVNPDGILLTSSFYFGNSSTHSVFDNTLLKDKAGIIETATPGGKSIIAGYTRVSDTSLILVLVKSKKKLTDMWLKPRLKLIGYLIVSIILILLSIMGMATFLVGRIHSADKKRLKALHHAGYTNKLASIGRLASGVAHEINNPLAIINQKTGLIMDRVTLKKELSSDERLMPLANDVLDAVHRCSTITRRLLDFARHMEPSIETVNIKQIIGQVLAFHKKAANHRGISISVDSPDSIPEFKCDRGSLQQIFLNLVDNAFAAMEDNGRLDIGIKLKGKKDVIITVSDTGKGISEDDIHNIFEPFYSSKDKHWGTGLGLSITYGLIKEIGGDIMVKSEIGKGTDFTLVFPITKEVDNDQG